MQQPVAYYEPRHTVGHVGHVGNVNHVVAGNPPIKNSALVVDDRVNRTNPIAYLLVGTLMLVNVIWWALQFVIGGWSANQSQFLLIQTSTVPSFIFRMISTAAIIIGVIHAERLRTTASAFASFINVTVNLMSWVLISLPIAYAAFSTSVQYATSAGTIGRGFQGLDHNYSRLLIAAGALSCAHAGVVFLLWCYASFQIARNHHQSFRVKLSLHDICNICMVAMSIAGLTVWAVSNAVLGTYNDRSYISTLELQNSAALIVALFFSVTSAAYVSFGAGRRLTSMAFLLTLISTMCFWSVFTYTVRANWETTVSWFNPTTANGASTACDRLGHCDETMAATAGLGMITGAQTLLTLVLLWATFRVPNDTLMTSEHHLNPTNTFVGQGNIIQKPATYGGAEMVGAGATPVPESIAIDMNRHSAFPANSYPETASYAPTASSTPVQVARVL